MTEKIDERLIVMGIRRFVSLIAIAGGLSGVVSTVSAVEAFSTASSHLVGGIFAILYGAGAWFGMRLLERNEEAAMWLKLYFWMQVPALQTTVISYFFAGLLSITFMYRFEFPIDAILAGAGGFTFAMWNGQQQNALGINVAPLVCLALLRILESLRVREPLK